MRELYATSYRAYALHHGSFTTNARASTPYSRHFAQWAARDNSRQGVRALPSLVSGGLLTSMYSEPLVRQPSPSAFQVGAHEG